MMTKTREREWKIIKFFKNELHSWKKIIKREKQKINMARWPKTGKNISNKAKAAKYKNN